MHVTSADFSNFTTTNVPFVPRSPMPAGEDKDEDGIVPQDLTFTYTIQPNLDSSIRPIPLNPFTVNNLISDANHALHGLLTSFGIKTVQREQNETELEVFQKHLAQISTCISNMQKRGVITAQDEPIIKDFKEKLIHFLEFSRNYEVEIKKYGTSEELLSFVLIDFTGFFRWIQTRYEINEKQTENLSPSTILEEKTEVKEEVNKDTPDSSLFKEWWEWFCKNQNNLPFTGGLSSQSKSEVHGLAVKNTVPGEEKSFGTVIKDKDCGNGMYMHNVGSITDSKCNIKTRPLGSYVVQLPDLKTLGERQKNEIDISLTLNPQGCKGNDCFVLPTHFGFKACALTLHGKYFNIPLKKIRVEQDSFGLTRLYNVPRGVQSIKYRLRPSSLGQIKDYSSDLVTPVSVSNLKPFEKTSDGSIRHRIAHIRSLFREYNPVYTSNTDIQRIISSSSNIFETATAMGFPGDCEYLTKPYANFIMLMSQGEDGLSIIPILVAEGLILNEEQTGFQENNGHVQVIFLDENGTPNIEEATILSNKDLIIDDKKVEADTPRALRLLDWQNKLNNYLSKVSPDWRIPNPQKPNNICTDTFLEGEGDDPIQTPEIQEESSESENNTREAQNEQYQRDYVKETKLMQERSVENLHTAQIKWTDGIQEADLKTVLGYLRTILDFDSAYQYCPDECGKCLMCNHQIHKLIIENDKHKPKYIKDFLDYIDRRKEKDLKKLQTELLEWLKQYEYRPIEKINVCCDRTYNLIEYPEIADKVFLVLDDEEFINSPDYYQIDDLADKLGKSSCTVDTKLILYEKIVKQFKRRFPGDSFFTDYEPLHLKLRDIAEINNLTPYGIKLYVDCAKIHGEEQVKRILRDGIKEALMYENGSSVGFLRKCHESGALTEYISRINDRYAITDDFKKELVKSFESSWSDLPTRAGLEELKYLGITRYDFDDAGIDHMLKDDIRHIREFGAFHKRQEKLDNDKPVSFLIARAKSGWNKNRLDEISQEKVSLCEYFDISLSDLRINKPSQTELWEDNLKPKIVNGEVNIPVTVLPKKQFERLAERNAEVKRFFELCNITWKPSEHTEAVNKLFETIIESQRIIRSRITKDPENLCKKVISDIVKYRFPKYTQYRFSTILAMFKRSKVDMSQIQNELKRHFESNGSLMEIYNGIFKNCSNKAEIIQELRGLSNEELKTFSYVLSESSFNINEVLLSDNEDLIFHVEHEPRTYGRKSNHKSVLFTEIENPKRNFFLEKLKSDYEDCIFYKVQASPSFKSVTDFCNSLTRRVSDRDVSILRKLPVRYMAYGSSFGPYAPSSEGDFDRHVAYSPNDDIRHFDTKVWARTGKNFTKKYTSPSFSSPTHYVADIESLMNDEEYEKAFRRDYDIIPDAVENLVSTLYAHTIRNKPCYMHLFYRGNLLGSTGLKEFREIFSSKEEVTDEFSIRSKKEDFAASLCHLSISAKRSRGSYEKSNDYSPNQSPFLNPISESDFWSPESGTVIAITSPEMLQKSLPVFGRWMQRGIAVAYWMQAS